MKIKFKKLRDNAMLPYAATEMSGGLDITAAHIEHVSDSEVIVYTGLAMQPYCPTKISDFRSLEKGESDRPTTTYRIRFSPRSSFTKYNWILQNSPALGDADFTGEYRLRFRAIPFANPEQTAEIMSINDENIYVYGKKDFEDFPYKVGDRCAQMWVERIIPVEFEEVQELEKTERGNGGFGSTDFPKKAKLI